MRETQTSVYGIGCGTWFGSKSPKNMGLWWKKTVMKKSEVIKLLALCSGITTYGYLNIPLFRWNILPSSSRQTDPFYKCIPWRWVQLISQKHWQTRTFQRIVIPSKLQSIQQSSRNNFPTGLNLPLPKDTKTWPSHVIHICLWAGGDKWWTIGARTELCLEVACRHVWA